MGIGRAEAVYEAAFKKLFLQGDYWDNQFADPESGVSLFCKAKLPAFTCFRRRMAALQGESYTQTTDELIADWERVLLDSIFPALSLARRRRQLDSMWTVRLNRAGLQKVADLYDLAIADTRFPYRPGFFGFSCFNNLYIGSPVTFSVLFITVQQADFRTKSWALIKPDYPATCFGRMRFGLDRMVYFPVNHLWLYIYKELRKSYAGFLKFGVNRLFYRFENSGLDDFRSTYGFPRDSNRSL